MKSKNENIMQFNNQSGTRGGKITVDSSDSEDNEEQSENDNLKKTVFVDWGKSSSNSASKKRQVISFNDLENQTKEEKQNVKIVPETPAPAEVDYQSSMKRAFSTSSIHHPQHKTEFYMKDEDDYYNSNSNNNYYYSNQRSQYGDYSGHRSHSSRRNQFYDNTEDNTNDNRYNYRNDNDSSQPIKFAFGQKQQVSQPQPQPQPQFQQPLSQPPPHNSFYKTQPPPRSQPTIQSNYGNTPQFKFFGGKEQPDPTLNQQEFRPQPARTHEFRPQQRQQDFRPNQQQKPISFNFNQQKQPQPNIHTFQPDPK